MRILHSSLSQKQQQEKPKTHHTSRLVKSRAVDGDRRVYDEAYMAFISHNTEEVRRSLAALRASVSKCVRDVAGKRQLNRKRQEMDPSAGSVRIFVHSVRERLMSRAGRLWGTRPEKPQARKVCV